MHHYRLTGKQPHILALTVLCVFASIGSVIITPALPNISHFFAVSENHTKLVVSAFLLGYALGQLIYGPPANRFGRLKTLHIGLGIAILGTLFTILSSSFESFDLLIVGRFIEAIGSSVGLVIATMMINDYYFPEQVKSRFAIIMIGVAIVPGIAVMLGGILSQYLGWKACFYFMLFYNVILFIIACTLPETKMEKEANSLQLRTILVRYKNVLHNKSLLLFASMIGLSAALIYIFSAEGPFIGTKIIGLSATIYGLIAMLPNVGLLFGSLLTRFFINKISSRYLLTCGILSQLTGAILLLVLFLLHTINLYSFIIPICLIFAGYPAISSISMGSAVSEVKDKANGTAMTNFFVIAFPVISTYSIGILPTNNPIVLPISYCVIVIVMVTLLLRIIRLNNKK